MQTEEKVHALPRAAGRRNRSIKKTIFRMTARLLVPLLLLAGCDAKGADEKAGVSNERMKEETTAFAEAAVSLQTSAAEQVVALYDEVIQEIYTYIVDGYQENAEYSYISGGSWRR